MLVVVVVSTVDDVVVSRAVVDVVVSAVAVVLSVDIHDEAIRRSDIAFKTRSEKTRLERKIIEILNCC